MRRPAFNKSRTAELWAPGCETAPVADTGMSTSSHQGWIKDRASLVFMRSRPEDSTPAQISSRLEFMQAQTSARLATGLVICTRAELPNFFI